MTVLDDIWWTIEHTQFPDGYKVEVLVSTQPFGEAITLTRRDGSSFELATDRFPLT